MSDFEPLSDLFGPNFDENDPENGLSGQDHTHVAHPDPEEGPVEWACWLCQAEGPIYTLELMNNESGAGFTYQVCQPCAERLLGVLEDGKEPSE